VYRNRLRLAVGLATVGRPDSLRAVIGCIRSQTRAPDQLVVCATCPRDIAGIQFDEGITTRLFSERGLTRQRNAILRHSSHFDVLVFFDDDFLAHPTYLEMLEQIFIAHPEVAMVTGQVAADGIIGPGVSAAEGLRVLADMRINSGPTTRDVVDVYNGYGCNMSVRLSAVRAGGIAFDEALPLYGWLEDVDFSRRLADYGRIVKSPAASGVHLGVKSGRQSGVRLGYSQIANPIYLVRKGSFAWRKAILQMARNVAMNVARYPRPEPYIDRRGRLRGNALALKDFMLAKLHPERVLSIENALVSASGRELQQ